MSRGGGSSLLRRGLTIGWSCTAERLLSFASVAGRSGAACGGGRAGARLEGSGTLRKRSNRQSPPSPTRSTSASGALSSGTQGWTTTTPSTRSATARRSARFRFDRVLGYVHRLPGGNLFQEPNDDAGDAPPGRRGAAFGARQGQSSLVLLSTWKSASSSTSHSVSSARGRRPRRPRPRRRWPRPR